MASGSSGGTEREEESTVLRCQPGPGCLGGDPNTRPSLEQGKLAGAEAIGHRRQLRKGNFQPKQHLEHLVEKLKLLDLEGGGEEEKHLCSWRRRVFAFKGDVKDSDAGRDGPRACGAPAAAHDEESAQEDQERMRRHLEKLKRQREVILELKISGERRCRDYLLQTEVERQKIVSEFRQLCRFLKDQELFLLVQLGELDREMVRRQEEEETKMSGEVSLLDFLICEMEKNLERPTRRFLQDVQGTVDRWDMSSTRKMTETFLELEQRLRVISQQTNVLGETLGRLQDTLPSELEKELGASPGGEGEAFVTLDTDTAHARLVVAWDRRGVRWAGTSQEVPPTPQRFDVSCCVLGHRGFTAGTHSWVVEVAAGRTWALGVARNSVPRKGWLDFRPEKGIWALGRHGNQYRAFASPIATFAATGRTGRVRVMLDYGAGRVMFYLGGGDRPVFAFQSASFGGEGIFPFFWLGRGAHLRLCP